MKARPLRDIAKEQLKDGPLRGDMAVAYAENPHQMMSVMMHSAASTGSTIVIRNGNSPELEYAEGDKPPQMKDKSIKAKTGAVFLFKGYIPFDETYLKSTSDNIKEKNKGQSSQLKVSLNKVMRTAGEYEKMEIKDGKLYLYPNEERIDDKNFKEANRDEVKKTVFIIDLDKGAPPAITPEELEKTTPGNPITNYPEPDGWDKERWGDFSKIQHNLYPVSYTKEIDKVLDGKQEPEAFKVLGDPAITGDLDLFWVVSSSQSVVNKRIAAHEGTFPLAHEKLNLDKFSEKRVFLKEFNKIVNAIKHEFPGADKMDKNFNFEELEKIKIEGIVTPSEAATIYFVNKFFNEAVAEKIAQMILHGPESNNPGNPSEMGELLHILPNGNKILTSNEEQLVQVVMSENYLENFPVPIHPKWDMSKWSEVVVAKMKLSNKPGNEEIYKVNEDTVKALEAYNKLVVVKDYDFLKDHNFSVNPIWDMEVWAPVIEQQMKMNKEIDSTASLELKQKIPEKTLEAYDKHISNQKPQANTRRFSLRNSPLNSPALGRKSKFDTLREKLARNSPKMARSRKNSSSSLLNDLKSPRSAESDRSRYVEESLSRASTPPSSDEDKKSEGDSVLQSLQDVRAKVAELKEQADAVKQQADEIKQTGAAKQDVDNDLDDTEEDQIVFRQDL